MKILPFISRWKRQIPSPIACKITLRTLLIAVSSAPDRYVTRSHYCSWRNLVLGARGKNTNPISSSQDRLPETAMRCSIPINECQTASSSYCVFPNNRVHDFRKPFTKYFSEQKKCQRFSNCAKTKIVKMIFEIEIHPT